MTKHMEITDEQLIEQIDAGVRNSVGGYTNSSEKSFRREVSSYEFAMEARGQLAPQGVSEIVSSSTTEIIEGYTALLANLLLDNDKLALFKPASATSVTAITAATKASDITNHCIFNMNPDGWSKLNTWIKSGLLFGNGIMRWGWKEDFDMEFETYEEISQVNLDTLLADPMVDIVGDLLVDEEVIAAQVDATVDLSNSVMYKDVKVRRKVDKSRVDFFPVPPETFFITRTAESIDEAQFVGLITDYTHSELRKMYPDLDSLTDSNGNEISLSEIGEEGNTRSSDWSIENFARKDAVGIDNWIPSNADDEADEPNQIIEVIECWVRSDRDGDGIAELIHIVKSGNTIIEEEEVTAIPLACFNPIEVPHEFFGLSMADIVRPQMRAETAIIRGFVENTYYGNYGIKYADPNAVDFAQLQNPEPKQVVATNGNPAAAVMDAQVTPISPGTTGVLEYLGLQKEQSTGLGKAAQGLNDALYVSGNSEQKLGAIQSAAQMRVDYVARRFVETAAKPFCRGVFRELRKNLKEGVAVKKGLSYEMITPEEIQLLPTNMQLDIQANLGENSNTSVLSRMAQMKAMLQEMGQDPSARVLLKEEGVFTLATKMTQQLNFDPGTFFHDPSTPEVQQMIVEAQQAAQAQSDQDMQVQQAEMEMMKAEKQAQTDLLRTEASNKVLDNARQMYTATENANIEWAKIRIMAQKEGVEIPERPEVVVPQPNQQVPYSMELVDTEQAAEGGGDTMSQLPPELMQMVQQDPEQAMAMAQQMGIPPEMIQQVLGGQ